MDQEEEIYCICKKPAGYNRFMILCDKCHKWFHGSCVKITKAKKPRGQWFCPPCIDDDDEAPQKQIKNARTKIEKLFEEYKVSISSEVQSLKMQVLDMKMQYMEKTTHGEKEEDMLQQKEKQLKDMIEQKYEEELKQKEMDLQKRLEQKCNEEIKQMEKKFKDEYDRKEKRLDEEWQKKMKEVEMECERKIKILNSEKEIAVREFKEKYEQKCDELGKILKDSSRVKKKFVVEEEFCITATAKTEEHGSL